jgi:hypothetical protein
VADFSLLVSLGHNCFRHDMLSQRSRGLQGGGNRFSTGDGDDRNCRLFHFHLGGICLGSCSQGSSAFGRLFFIFTLAAGIFIDALATLAFDTLIARRTTGTTLAFGLLIVLLYCVGGLFGNNRSIGGQGGNVADRGIDPDLLAQLTTFATLSHFFFFQTRLVVDHGGIDGFYRVNDHFGARFTRSAGFTSRARCAGFAFWTWLTSLARFTFHALFTHFATGFTLLDAAHALCGDDGCGFHHLHGWHPLPAFCGIGRAAVTTVVITTTTLTTAAGFIALMTMTLILACFALGCRFVGRSLHVGRVSEPNKPEMALNSLPNRPASGAAGAAGATTGPARRSRLGRLDKTLQQRLFALDHLSLLRLVDRLGNLGFQLVAGRFGISF